MENESWKQSAMFGLSSAGYLTSWYSRILVIRSAAEERADLEAASDSDASECQWQAV